jgi:transcriptional regulator with XRE-family HTH domain
MSANAGLKDRIAAQRKALGLSQAEVAKKLDVSTALIGFWETGRSDPPQLRVAQLEKVLGPLSKSRPANRVRVRVDPVILIDTEESRTILNSEIGFKIRAGRIASGLTQAALGEKIGVTAAAVGNWETGKPVSEGRLADLEKIIGRISSGGSHSRDNSQTYEVTSLVGNWLSKALIRKDWTSVELAEKSGVSPATIYNLQNGRAENPRRATIEKLEKALGERLPNEIKDEVEEQSEIQGIPGIGDFIDFDPHDNSEWPADAGVYVFYDITKRPVYVGQGNSITQRIKDHSTRQWFIFPYVQSASYIRIDNKEHRVAIEKILIKFLKTNAVINRQGVDRD